MFVVSGAASWNGVGDANAGVLFTGDSWDYEKADGTRGDRGEIWFVTNVLTYKF